MKKHLHEYSLEKEIIVLTMKTIDILLGENPDSLTLYVFYIKMAKRQDNRSVRATDTFCIKGLHWGKERFKTAKNVLTKYGLIETICRKNESGRITGFFVLIKYLFNGQKERDISEKEINIEEKNHSPRYQSVVPPVSGFSATNALVVEDKYIGSISKMQAPDGASTSKTLHFSKDQIGQEEISGNEVPRNVSRETHPENEKIVAAIKAFEILYPLEVKKAYGNKTIRNAVLDFMKTYSQDVLATAISGLVSRREEQFCPKLRGIHAFLTYDFPSIQQFLAKPSGRSSQLVTTPGYQEAYKKPLLSEREQATVDFVKANLNKQK